MASTNYVSVNGMIVGEATGGANRAYGTDALGSVVATYFGTSLENTYQYKPFGEVLSKAGLAVDPSFLWGGAGGFRYIGLTNLGIYLRDQHLNLSGRSISVIRGWPRNQPYSYAPENPVATLGGLTVCKCDQLHLKPGGKLKGFCWNLVKDQSNSNILGDHYKCNPAYSSNDQMGVRFLAEMYMVADISCSVPVDKARCNIYQWYTETQTINGSTTTAANAIDSGDGGSSDQTCSGKNPNPVGSGQVWTQYGFDAPGLYNDDALGINKPYPHDCSSILPYAGWSKVTPDSNGVFSLNWHASFVTCCGCPGSMTAQYANSHCVAWHIDISITMYKSLAKQSTGDVSIGLGA